MPGRPPKLTPEIQERIVLAVRAGNYLSVSARAAGVHESTLYRWLERGRGPAGREPYRSFCEALKEAEAAAEVHAVATIRQQMPSQWTAAMTFLERRFPDRWRRRDTVYSEEAPPSDPIEDVLADPDTRRLVADLEERLAAAPSENGSSVPGGARPVGD